MMVRMRAISLDQPYADWICDGSKTLETRPWRTNYRGDILIVSTKRRNEHQGPRGMALCLAEIRSIRRLRPEDQVQARIEYRPHLWAWELDNIRPLNPFPVRGRQQIYYVEVDEALLAPLAA